MKNDSALRIKYLRFMALYGITMLVIIILLTLKKDKDHIIDSSDADTNETITQVEYVYVRPQDITTQDEIVEEIYTVKSYNGKIGIFSADGTLVETLDTNIKTLPEADKRLLEEGFQIKGRSQLNSIIEDYTE